MHGGQAELVREPLASSTLMRIPDDLGDAEGLALGDVLATGYHCARMAGVEPRGTYVVLGCGPVGLMAILATRWLGAERVFAVDSIPDRLAMAARFGAQPVSLGGTPTGTTGSSGDGFRPILPLRHHDKEGGGGQPDSNRPDAAVIAAIHNATNGRGADAVLEAVGSPAAGRLAYDVVRPGGTIAVVGVHHAPVLPFSASEAYDKNLTYRVGRCPARAYMPALIGLARARQLEIAAIFTHRVPLADGPTAYAMFDVKADGCVKVILEV